MKWRIEQVKVRLRDVDSGETVDVVQKPDGGVDCEPGPKAKATKKTPEDVHGDRAPRKDDSKGTAKAVPEKRAGGVARASGRKRSKPAAETTAKAAGKKATDRPRPERARPSSLEWEPVQDAKYHGFAAKSGNGTFKVLKSRNSSWALFYDRTDADSLHIQCFRKEKPAMDRAQKLHDKGMPPFKDISDKYLRDLCPASDDEEVEPEERTEPEVAEDKPVAQPAAEAEAPITPPADPPTELTPELRAEMRNAMQTAIRAAIQEA